MTDILETIKEMMVGGKFDDIEKQVSILRSKNLGNKRGSFCPQCGAKTPPDSSFCSDCGTRL